MIRALALIALAWLSLVMSAEAGRPATGGAIVVLDAATGAEVRRIGANGAVITAVADNRGGWFVGGDFTRIGGRPRVAIAHVLSSGKVDPAWRVPVGSASGRPVAVHTLALGRGRLFVAGPFGTVGGVPRPGLAAVDAVTARVVRTWRAGRRAWLDISALLVAGRRLLVAAPSAYPTPGITAVSTETGAVDRAWNVGFRLVGGAGTVNTLLRRRERVYVAGTFRIQGLRRNGLAAVAARDGRPDARFAPSIPNCSVCNGFGVVYGLASAHGRLFVSGHFSAIGGLRRNGIAALDPRTGIPDPQWTAARGGRDILRLASFKTRLYLGGMRGLAALDAVTGTTVPVDVRRTPRHVLSLAVSGNRLLVAGRE